MQNKLLEALQNDDSYPNLDIYLCSVTNAQFRADINDLLLKQRERCAEEVPLSYKLHEPLKENIINAKLI
jgi:hypothetical protein